MQYERVYLYHLLETMSKCDISFLEDGLMPTTNEIQVHIPEWEVRKGLNVTLIVLIEPLLT